MTKNVKPASARKDDPLSVLLLSNSPMTNVKIKKTEGSEESAELLAKSVVQVAEGFQAMLRTPLQQRAIICLLHDGIGQGKITKGQIKLVLDALPRLKAWYVKS